VAAPGQPGPCQQIAAAGASVVWADNAPNAMGQVVRLIDGSGQPPVRVNGLVNVGMVAIDPSSGAFFWEDFPSGGTNAGGHFLADGAIFSSIPGLGPVTGLLPQDLALSSSGTLYWGELTTDSIDCLGCAQPLAQNELAPNTLTVHLNRVYWGSSGGADDLIRELVVGRDAAPRTLATITPRVAYGMAADDAFLYWIDYDGSTGAVDDSRIVALPWDGGAMNVLVPHTHGAFPIVAFKGNVFYSDGTGVHSVPSTGGAPVDVVTGTTIPGFALAAWYAASAW
jgi:hypothetical protein